MNRLELRTRLRTDLHKASYSDGDLNSYIASGEGLIRSKLTAYAVSYTFTDADRAVSDSPVYTLPGRVLKPQSMICADIVLSQSDETMVSMHRTSTVLQFYALRPSSVIFAGNPSAGSEIEFNYFGMPAALNDVDNNALSDDYPQLYFHAAAVYTLERARDYESAQLHMTSALTIIKDINTAMRRQLGRPTAAPIYNTSWRSSY